MTFMIRTRRRTAASAPVLATLVAIAILAVPGRGAGAPAYLMTDAAIADKIEDQMLIDHAVPAARIDARADDGIVTLTGVVSNILAKDRAARIAETVKGVRAVVNTITVEPAATRQPIEIEQDIANALADDPATDTWGIVPKVAKGGAVTLTGTVESRQQRDLAALVAKGVKGVKRVDNQIEVRSAEDRPDRDIEAEIERALRWDMLVDDALIGVAVEDGTVHLAGTVGSAAEARRARLHAWTTGVTAVDASELVVATWTRDPALRGTKHVVSSDDDIAAAVRDALRVDPRIDGSAVDVTVLGGSVVLRGAVDSLRAKRAAAEDARHTAGVIDVVDRLKVRPSVDVANEALSAKVSRALVRDPFVERFEMTATVVNGTAYLEGTVDTYFEKARADSVAAGVNGVVDVVNNLEVRHDVRPYVYDPYRDDPYVYDFDWYALEPRTTFEPDAEIKEAIESELWWSPFVDSDRITVTVEDGVATLEGSVESWSEFSAARENALEGGAIWVDNDLSVAGTLEES